MTKSERGREIERQMERKESDRHRGKERRDKELGGGGKRYNQTKIII